MGILVESLLLIEINVRLLKKKIQSGKDEEEMDIISIRTMAEETLGKWGGIVFLGYSSMIAYTSKSSGIFFTDLFTLLICVGRTKTTDQVKQVAHCLHDREK